MEEMRGRDNMWEKNTHRAPGRQGGTMRGKHPTRRYPQKTKDCVESRNPPGLEYAMLRRKGKQRIWEEKEDTASSRERKKKKSKFPLLDSKTKGGQGKDYPLDPWVHQRITHKKRKKNKRKTKSNTDTLRSIKVGSGIRRGA